MNNIIKQLSQIEDRSVHILDDGAARKKELTAEYEEKIHKFEETLNNETEAKINALKQEMEVSMKAQLNKQKEDAASAISRLEQHYEASHGDYVKELFKEMTEV